MANNCSNNTSNSCSPCSSCEEIISGDCVLYDGTGLSGITYPENPTMNQIIYALFSKIQELEALIP